MITTIPADYIMMFIIGMIYSVATFQNIAKTGTVVKNKYFLSGLVYQTIVCMPIAIYCYVVFPDWCWMYWLDSKAVPQWLVFLAFSFYYVLFLGGFVAGFFSERTKRGWGLKGLGIAILIFLIFACVTYRRLFYVGSIEEFHQGRLALLFEQKILAVIVFGGMLLAIVFLIIILSRFGMELDYHPSQEELNRFRRKKRSVSVTRIEDNNVRRAIEKSLDAWDGLDYLKGLLREKRLVLLKPNLAGGGKDSTGSQTSPELIGAAMDMIRVLQPEARILIGESGSIVWWDLRPLLRASRYERLLEEKGCEFANLSMGKKDWHDFGGRMGKELVPEILLQDPLIIDMPVAKTHSFYRMSGALKNMFGILPVPSKFLRYHIKGFADWQGRVFLDIYRNFPPHLVIIDGSVSGEGYCPVAGRPKPTGFIVTADDAIAADLILSKIMGFDTNEIPYLRVAGAEGMLPQYALFGLNSEEVVSGEWRKVRKRLWGLVLNCVSIALEHRKIRTHD